ncbi:MAG: hypothetical protein P4L84_09865 [Isosphaeraceae bacterium]|nr:hypothetical protein [Isosphaeraceae bacterium]
MSGLLRRFWKRPESAAEAPVDPRMDRDSNPVAVAGFSGSDEIPLVAAGAYEGEAFGLEIAEFFTTFHHRPGIRLIDYIDENNDERLRSWFDWRCPEAEPKAFVRLMLAMMRAGREVWDQPDIRLFLRGRWSQGPGPSKQSIEAISVVAQLIGKTITELYSETKKANDGTDPPLKTLIFEP